jgi:hypothetical protein
VELLPEKAGRILIPESSPKNGKHQRRPREIWKYKNRANIENRANREIRSAAEPQPNRDWPQKNAKIAKNKLHKSLPLSSLRSFAAKILLELHDSPEWHCEIRETGELSGEGYGFFACFACFAV